MRRHAKASSAGSTSSTGLRRHGFVAAMALGLLALALGASSAFAAQSHPFVSSFGTGELGEPRGIGVDQASGDVYVSDTSAGSVFKYDSAGAPENFSALGSNALPFNVPFSSQIAVDGSAGATAGRFYTNEYRVLKAFQPSGAPANFSAAVPYASGNELTGTPNAGFDTINGVAVGDDGAIYVSDLYVGKIWVFAPSGQFLAQISTESPGQLGVDSAGNVYVGGGETKRFSPSVYPVTPATTYGGPVQVAGPSVALAVDADDDDLYVLRSTSEFSPADVAQFTSASSGNDLVGRSGTDRLTSGARGLALDRSGGPADDGFVVPIADRVDRFGPAATLPDATTGDATEVTSTTAKLGGSINPVGTEASYQFEYGTDTTYGQKAPGSPVAVGNDNSEHPQSVSVTGLQPETTYHYRIVGSNPDGAYPGLDKTFTTLTAVKEVKTSSATNLTPTSARLNGSVDPGGLTVSGCEFEYGPTESLGQTAPCAESSGEIGTGEGPVAVHADVGGLSTGLYHFRLVATNAVGTTRGSSQIAAVPGPPVILGQSVGIEQGKVFLKARVNPANQQTTYHFEYGLTAAYGGSTPVETLAAGNDPVFLSEQVDGLIAGAEYHFRLVATNGIASVQGPDQTFRAEALQGGDGCANAPIRAAQGTTGLPDCRAYEHVSAGGKNGKNLFGIGFPLVYLTATGPDGSAATFQSNGAFGDAQSGSTLTDYVAQRRATGWFTHAVSDSRYLGADFKALISVGGWSEDLSQAVLYAGDEGLAPGVSPLAPGATPGQTNIYRNDLGTHGFDAVSLDAGPAPSPENAFFLTFAGGSTDFSTIAFEDIAPHAADTPPASFVNSYAWHDDGSAELVGILPGGEATAEARIGGGPGYSRQNAVSDDGSRIFFTTADGRVFVRIDRSRTVELTASEKAVPDPHQWAEYKTATPDGRYAFFLTAEQLVDEDTNSVSDLYRYDVDTETLTWISRGAQGPEYFGATDVAGSSADGSHVYFTAIRGDYDGVVPASVPVESPQLFLWHNGQFDYVGAARAESLSSGSTPFADVTPDGRAITFTTGEEQPILPEFDPQGRAQVYVYDADGDTLACASCRPDGKAPTGNAMQPHQTLDSNGTAQQPAVNVNLISDDGSRVFFTSPDPLVTRDVNEKNDAYEFVDGKVHLLSSGLGEGDSNFQNSTPDGKSAFFTSIDQLVPSDRDVSIDLYVARGGGGFDESTSLPCSGEACRPGVAAPPAAQSAGSAQFSGPGNANQRAQQKAKKKKQKKKVRKKGKKKRAGKSKGASKRNAGK